jgi:hypothetical protein
MATRRCSATLRAEISSLDRAFLLDPAERIRHLLTRQGKLVIKVTGRNGWISWQVGQDVPEQFPQVFRALAVRILRLRVVSHRFPAVYCSGFADNDG